MAKSYGSVETDGSIHPDIPDTVAYYIYERFGDISTLAWAANCDQYQVLKLLKDEKTVQILSVLEKRGNDERVLMKYLIRRYSSPVVAQVLIKDNEKLFVLKRVASALDLSFEELAELYFDYDEVVAVSPMLEVTKRHGS